METQPQKGKVSLIYWTSTVVYLHQQSYVNLLVPLGYDACARANPSGRSAAWLARLVRDQEVDGSNPFAPTILIPALI